MNIATHNGTFTLVSRKTGDHRTVKISTIRKGQSEFSRKFEGRRTVSMLTGPNNESDYRMFGWVNDDGGIRLCAAIQTQPFFVALADIVANPDKWADKVDYKFEGRCVKCNRKLTDPVSIDLGIGPECGGRV